MHRKAKVWIVDDDSSIRWVLERALTQAGIENESFPDADQLLARIVSEQPDVIISDIRMPGTDGLELLAKINDTYPELRSSGDAAFDGLKLIIEEGQNRGVFKQGDVEVLALAAWSGIHGLSMLLISGNLPEILGIPVELRSLTTAITTTLLEGLKAH